MPHLKIKIMNEFFTHIHLKCNKLFSSFFSTFRVIQLAYDAVLLQLVCGFNFNRVIEVKCYSIQRGFLYFIRNHVEEAIASYVHFNVSKVVN